MTAKEFLEEADGLSIKKLSREHLEVDENGKANIGAHFQDSLCLGEEKKIEYVSMLFKNLNFLLDENKELQGSFKERYKKLHEKSEVEKIFKNIYRILKLIRNAEEHNNKSKVVKGNVVEIKYSYKDTDFFLKFDNGRYSLLEKLFMNLFFYMKMDIAKNIKRCFWEVFSKI